MGLWEERAVSMAHWRLFSAICELAEGTSCLVLPPDMNRPQRTCHKKISDFPLLWMIYGIHSWLIYALQAWAWAETHHNRVNPQVFFFFSTHKDKTCGSLLYTFLMQEEYRSAWISRPCSLNPLCRRFQGSQLYCVSTHSRMYATIAWFSASLGRDENSTWQPICHALCTSQELLHATSRALLPACREDKRGVVFN